MTDIRIGNGYDVHRLVRGRKLMLGCVEIPHDLGLLGHSDADVLCHAIADAMLGACALGDIGRHFPDNDPKYEGCSGELILKYTLELCTNAGYTVSNIDSIIVAQKPRLKEHIPHMVECIAHILSVRIDQVNVKATTEEGLGFTGVCDGISAHAVCLMRKIL